MKKQITVLLTVTFSLLILMSSCGEKTKTERGPLDKYKVNTESGTEIEGIYAKLYNSIADKSSKLFGEDLTPEQATETIATITSAYQKYDTYSYNYAHLVSDGFRTNLETKFIKLIEVVDEHIEVKKYANESAFLRMGDGL